MIVNSTILVLQIFILIFSIYFLKKDSDLNKEFIQDLKKLNSDFKEECQKLRIDFGEEWKE